MGYLIFVHVAESGLMHRLAKSANMVMFRGFKSLRARFEVFNMDMKTIAIIVTCFYAISAIINLWRVCIASKLREVFVMILALVIQCVTIFLIWNF